MEQKTRIIMAKPGLDGHDRGIKVLAAPEMIVSAALQEDADVIALSSLNYAHNTIFPSVLELMTEQGLDNVLLVGGGIIPKKDIIALEKAGVGKLFGPGTPVRTTIEYITDWVEQNRR